MENTSLSAASAMVLFTAVAKGNKLQLLNIGQNNITDDAGDVIAASLKINSSLHWLKMRSNKISAKIAHHIVKALQQNNTLKELWLPSTLILKLIGLNFYKRKFTNLEDVKQN